MSKARRSGYLSITAGILFFGAGIVGNQAAFFGVGIVFIAIGAHYLHSSRKAD